MPLIRIKKDLEINYTILNPTGLETITVVHGMFGNLSQFYLSIGPELAKTYRVILYDLKSHGKSVRYPSGYDLDSFAEELILLLEALDISTSHLMGYSFGALVTLRAGVRYPHKIDKIIAMEVPPLPPEPIGESGEYNWDHFMDFAHSLPKEIIENFFSSERKLKKTYKIYEFIFNHTSFVEDTNARKPLSEEELKSVTSDTLFLFGNQSVCLGELQRIAPWIGHQYIYICEGKHDFFVNNSAKVALLMKRFFEGSLFGKEEHVKVEETVL